MLPLPPPRSAAPAPEVGAALLPHGSTRFVRASGSTLFDAEGRAYLDAAAGLCPLGHAHPSLLSATDRALDACPPNLLHIGPSVPAAELAKRLSSLTGGALPVSLFATSASEAVEAGIKLARAATGRSGLLRFEGASHGRTLGALSLGDHSASLDPLLPGCAALPPGDEPALERALRQLRPAALFVDPLGVPGTDLASSLLRLRALCREHGALLVVDESRSGLGGSGAMLASQAAGLSADRSPDVVILGGALSGGLAPIGVALVKEPLHARSFAAVDRFDLHGSTFAANALSCAAAIATLDALVGLSLPASAARLGARLSALVAPALQGRGARLVGRGLRLGIELEGRGGQGGAALSASLLARGIHAEPDRERASLLRLEPPLVISDEEVERLGWAVGEALSSAPNERG